MGTNYYVRTKEDFNICEKCGHRLGEIHVGKQSFGWPFLFHNYKATGKEWFSFLNKNKNKIFDEYGHQTDSKELIQMIKENKDNKEVYKNEHEANQSRFISKDGYTISNHSAFC